MLPSFALERPDRLVEALDLLGGSYVPYCGGTELLMAMKLGVLSPPGLVDLKRLDELRAVRYEGGRLLVGAAATHQAVASHEEVLRRLPVLAAVERRVGNARVRAQGSIGGNLCFAEPRSDVTTLLAALGARVVLASARGRREVPMSEFLTGAYETLREPDELLVEVVVEGAERQWGVHLKHHYLERPTVSVALVADERDGRFRLAVGAVGETPYLVEASAPGQIDPDAVAAGVDPVEDIGGSVAYKRHLTAVIVRQVLRAVPERGAA